MSKVLNVLYQSDDNYAPITGVSATSLMENNKDLDEINIYLLNDRISDTNLEKFENCCKHYGRNLIVLETTEIITKLKDELHVAPWFGTYTTYFKLFAFKDLQLPTDRVLQLDGDTIINGSLAPLCDMDLDGYLLAATYDLTRSDYKELIGIPLNDKIYNGGVLLVNQPEWIRENCEEKITHHLKNVRSGYHTVDQDILNVLFRHKFKYLDITYNYSCGFYIFGIKESLKIYGLKPDYYSTYEEIAAAYDDPVIYHCMGQMTGRPWELNSIHPQNELYDKYMHMSPWRDYEKKYVKRDLIFRVQRILYRALPRGIYAIFHKCGQKQYLKARDKIVQGEIAGVK